MLMTIKELMTEYIDEGYSIERVFRDDKWHNVDENTPLCYRGVYTYIGYANIWNDVGCIEHTFKMYRSNVRHTILYDDDKRVKGF